MKANELRRRYIDFFVKNYAHAEIRGSSLIPENDPTVLFTTAGMHPLVPFLMGENHPSGKLLVNVQKCIRTDDIDEVGDNRHLTFFEMLGNWSLGDYFKDLAIEMSFNFMTRSEAEGGLGIPYSRLCVTCFEGDANAPKDEEAAGIWEKFGFKKKQEGEALSGGLIYFFSKKENWWGPAGQTGPCGPDTEMYYITDKPKCPLCDEKGPSCDCGKCVEIWNDVFMQYNKKADGTFEPLKQQNVDTGMGFERVMFLLDGVETPFETDLFKEVIAEIRLLSGKSEINEEEKVSERIIADHVRASTFLLGEDMQISPSNTDQGYILRRLIRRAVRHGMKLGIKGNFIRKLAGIVVKNYGDYYEELQRNQERIYEEISREEERFNKTLHTGVCLLEKEMKKLENRKGEGVKAFADDFTFQMFATFGFPLEMTIEELKINGWIRGDEDLKYLNDKFEELFKKHQETSREGAEQKFAGGLADHSIATTKLHTATHLLHQALREVLGAHVEQKGANITAERLRFDFCHPEKMTPEQIKTVEDIVNEEIQKELPVTCEQMSVSEAKERGAIGLFESKYGDTVKVYTVGKPEASHFSKEICGGPHVQNTKELGHFRIIKEESSSSGVRRIKAVLE